MKHQKPPSQAGWNISIIYPPNILISFKQVSNHEHPRNTSTLWYFNIFYISLLNMAIERVSLPTQNQMVDPSMDIMVFPIEIVAFPYVFTLKNGKPWKNHYFHGKNHYFGIEIVRFPHAFMDFPAFFVHALRLEQRSPSGRH